MIAPLPQLLRTDREDLILREFFTDEDDQALFASVQRSHDHLLPFCQDVVLNLQSLEDVRQARVDAEKDNKILRMGIWLGEDNTLVGEADSIPRGNSIAEIRYWLDVNHVGNGYATLAVKALTRRARYMAYERAVAEVHSDNEKSIRVLERAGFGTTGQMLGAYAVYAFPKPEESIAK